MAEAAPESMKDTLFVLPEMWATGFCVEPKGIAENEEESIALTWMRDTAQSRGCALSGSLAIRTNEGEYRNRHYNDEDKGNNFFHGFPPENFMYKR